MRFIATYFGSSSWLLELGDFRILIDPWFRGDLFFAPGPWLINGQLQKEFPIPHRINLLLLTQGLEDHSHPSSLDLLDKSIPVISSSSGAKVVQKLGFSFVNKLNPSESIKIDDVVVRATAGANVPILENGYIVSNNDLSFYIEPHGFLDPKIKPCKLDAVITPVVNLKLPLIGSFIKGKTVLPSLIKTFNPKFVLASTTGGDAIFSGLLNNFISVEGTNKEASDFLANSTTFIDPSIGKPYELSAVEN